MKAAFVFPGQGAQYVGMGKELYDSFEIVRRIFDKASEILGEDFVSLVFNGNEDELKKTENTQPAILMVCTAISELLMQQGICPAVTAGLSLGEYSALVAARSIDYEDALPLVRKRGIYMQQAVPLGEGTMAAIIGLEASRIEECCRLASDAGIVEIANYNCPGQIVVSGHVAAVERVCQLAKDMGAKRTVPLSVSAPFHSSLLKPAGLALERELKRIKISNPVIPVISNVEAKPVQDPQHIEKLLTDQVSHSVRWEESIRYMAEQGFDTFIEVGPGKVLNGFLKKISKELKGFHVEDLESLESTLKGLEESE